MNDQEFILFAQVIVEKHGAGESIKIVKELRQETGRGLKEAIDASWPWRDDFTKHYLVCVLWSTIDNNEEFAGDPLDYNIEDFDLEALHQIREDCMSFKEQAGELLDVIDPKQAGHDFWLTRNHHGAGFWDRGLGEVGRKLTEIAHSFGECHLEIGDDGKIHIL